MLRSLRKTEYLFPTIPHLHFRQIIPVPPRTIPTIISTTPGPRQGIIDLHKSKRPLDRIHQLGSLNTHLPDRKPVEDQSISTNHFLPLTAISTISPLTRTKPSQRLINTPIPTIPSQRLRWNHPLVLQQPQFVRPSNRAHVYP